MCGRYVVVSKIKAIEKRFRTSALDPNLFEPSANISIGDFAPVISSDHPQSLQLFQFGLTPSWAKKKMYLFNARSEGDQNKEDDPNYRGAMGITQKPAFRSAIRSKRCLIIADAFIEGSKTDKLNKPYLLYMRDKRRPFAFAGIWDSWTDRETGELSNSFAIITTVANSLLQKIGHHRSPVILSEENEKAWINPDLPLAEVSSLLKPYPAEEMNAYPISNTIKNPRIKHLDLLAPLGDRIFQEYDYEIYEELKLEGMGMTTARIRKNDETTTPKSGSTPSLFD